MNIFKEGAAKYLEKGYSPIPDKFMGKNPLITGWSDFCYKLPNEEEINSWSGKYEKTNLAIAMGPASGIIALDIDETREEILDLILRFLPKSPVAKKGAKGETRFFRYSGEHTEALKFGGEMVVEILSAGKKTTIPPSVHPSGVNYQWVGLNLLSIDKKELPQLPPMLLPHLASVLRTKFPDMDEKPGANHSYESGRNNALSSYCGELIGSGKTVEEITSLLVEKDKEINNPPLFSDPEENRQTEPLTNALRFYVNHLTSVNTKRYREGKEYEVPVVRGSEPGKPIAVARESQQRSSSYRAPLPAYGARKMCPLCWNKEDLCAYCKEGLNE